MMNNPANIESKKTRVRRSEEEWKALVSGFAESDLTLEKYCQKQGIASGGFYKWRKRFESENSSDAPTFVEMLPPTEPYPSLQDQSVWRMELQLQDGIVLRLR